jgi:hypothetical protein
MTQDTTSIVDHLLGVIDIRASRFAIALPGSSRPPESLEQASLVEGHTESLDDVLTLGIIGWLILSLGLRHIDKVIIYPAPSELGRDGHTEKR